MIFEHLDWWWDEVARPGPEAMAVDEWLFETVERPTLRVYAWQGMWASVGYFGNLAEAQRHISDRKWVRRWTGGGTVDHVGDWTYTVVVPTCAEWMILRGRESYRVLHEALAEALAGEGLMASLMTEGGGGLQSLCFRNPVCHDLMAHGEKLAGAGQRRTRRGLLHQGSVAGKCEGERSLRRAELLAKCLSENQRRIFPVVPDEWVGRKVGERYGVSGTVC